jgi:hypothetical protein
MESMLHARSRLSSSVPLYILSSFHLSRSSTAVTGGKKIEDKWVIAAEREQPP